MRSLKKGCDVERLRGATISVLFGATNLTAFVDRRALLTYRFT